MSVPYRITVRVSEDTMEKLEELVDLFNFDRVSDIIRKAVDEFIERNYSTASKKKVDLLIPRNVIDEVQEEVDQVDKISLEDLVRIVLKNYTARKMNEEMKNLVTGNIEKDKKTRRKGKDQGLSD
jgi:CopG family nickel-responsive transcriptional regulator